MHRSCLRRPKRYPAVVVAALFLAGCGHMPVTSMIKLAQVDFAKTDPAQLRAAVKLPRVVRPRPQGMALRITVKLADGHEEFADFKLLEASDPKELLDLRRELDANSHISPTASRRRRRYGLRRFARPWKRNRRRAAAKAARSPSQSVRRRVAPANCPGARSRSPPICGRRKRGTMCRSRGTSICARSSRATRSPRLRRADDRQRNAGAAVRITPPRRGNPAGRPAARRRSPHAPRGRSRARAWRARRERRRWAG